MLVMVLEQKMVEILLIKNCAQLPQITGLRAEKAPTNIPVKYVNFAFSPDLASKLLEHIKINNPFIKLVNANGFIRPSKSPAGAPILFNKDPFGCVSIIDASITSR